MKKSKQKKNPKPPHLDSCQMNEYLSKKREEALDKEAETQQIKQRGKEGRQRGAATAKEAAREAKKAQAKPAKQ